MSTHMKNTQNGFPVCRGRGLRSHVFILTSNIDEVDCIICLRDLVKDAVIYGNARKAKRNK
jgi:hypothetical protein